VWSATGRNGATLVEFFAELGDRRHLIRSVDRHERRARHPRGDPDASLL
jgi:hypothetical protein